MFANVYSKSYLQNSKEMYDISKSMLFDRLLPIFQSSAEKGSTVEVLELSAGIGVDFISLPGTRQPPSLLPMSCMSCHVNRYSNPSSALKSVPSLRDSTIQPIFQRTYLCHALSMRCRCWTPSFRKPFVGTWPQLVRTPRHTSWIDDDWVL